MLNSRMGVSGTFFLFTACNLLSAVFGESPIQLGVSQARC